MTALTELCNEQEDLAVDARFTKRMVCVYVNLTDKEAQYLAVKHNRQQSFVHQMTTQDNVNYDIVICTHTPNPKYICVTVLYTSDIIVFYHMPITPDK